MFMSMKKIILFGILRIHLKTTEKLIKESYGDSVKIVDKMYDSDSGVAAIAVYDDLTKETYISYAGTNMGADGHKDPIVDLAIALNDTLYLKEKKQTCP